MIAVKILPLVIILAAAAAAFFAGFIAGMRKKGKTGASQAKTDFLSGMSHELRTPLNGIIGLSHLIIMHAEEPEKARLYARRTLVSARYLLALLDDLLDLSKYRGGRLTVLKRPMDLGRLCDAVESLIRDRFDGRGVALTVERELLCDCVLGDETRLKQVILNILSVALRSTPEGGKVRLAMTQKRDDRGFLTYISVEDTGNGLSPTHLAEVFSGRLRRDVSLKEPWLGLAVCRMIIEKMGGKISAKSSLGKGSTFFITLPSQQCHRDEENQPCTERMDRECLSSVRILIAEDNELNAEIISEILSANGFTVTVAKDGLEALEKFRDSPVGHYSIILMDLQMPRMDGREAAERIRGLDREDAMSVIIFACTANVLKEDRESALASGMDDFLTKPIDVTEVVNKICDHIETQEDL